MLKSSENKEFLKEARINSETRRERAKRTIIPSNVKVSKSPSLNTLINDALSIIGAELSQYRNKTNRGLTLELKEARAVQGYMDSLVKMSREAREAQKPQDLSELTDEQLLEIAKSSMESLPEQSETNLEDKLEEYRPLK